MSQGTLFAIWLRVLLPVSVFGLLLLTESGQSHQEDVSGGSQTSGGSEQEQTNNRDPVERGWYLVHDVAMCIQCHTPRTSEGELQTEQLLEGAPLPVSGPYPNQQWATRAPKLAGLPGGWSDAELATFLETGETPTGVRVRPPMPQFRMHDKDATAVAAYLKSLNAN